MSFSIHRPSIIAIAIAVALICGLPSKSDGSITIGAVSVSSPAGSDALRDINNLINQSGLSDNYVSGVTDFSSYVASTTATYAGGGWTIENALGGAQGSSPDFVFDLGSVFSVDGAHLWNQSGTASIVEYDFYGSLDGVSYSDLGPGTFAPQGVTTPGVTSTWSATAARYIKISNVTNAGYGQATVFNEIVFSGDQFSAVPEPGALAIWTALGMVIGIGAYRRRKLA